MPCSPLGGSLVANRPSVATPHSRADPIESTYAHKTRPSIAATRPRVARLSGIGLRIPQARRRALRHEDLQRRLGQIGVPAEVVDPEDVRAAFGRRFDDLRRGDLSEPGRVQRDAEASGARRGYLEAGRSCGWRRLVGAWSSIVGSVAVSVGLYRSNGGDSARPDSIVTAGSVSSTPPGACAFATTRPSTCRTVSSPASVTAAAGRSVRAPAHDLAVAPAGRPEPGPNGRG